MALEDTHYTEADFIALKKAIKSGARRVKGSDGKEVEYRSLAEMRATLAEMQREVYGRRVRRTVQLIEIKSEGS